mmetsp:Transcript_66188/g.191814  ORF Transcript_66188/g.191814 Transcript_66188/m.191814 type:complete len:497 (-) Transcript_66188:45-1535(-)
MALPAELLPYAENLYRRFPEEFIALGMPGLENVFDLRPCGTWTRSIRETPLEKTVEITIRRWSSPPSAMPGMAQCWPQAPSWCPAQPGAPAAQDHVVQQLQQQLQQLQQQLQQLQQQSQQHPDQHVVAPVEAARSQYGHAQVDKDASHKISDVWMRPQIREMTEQPQRTPQQDSQQCAVGTSCSVKGLGAWPDAAPLVAAPTMGALAPTCAMPATSMAEGLGSLPPKIPSASSISVCSTSVSVVSSVVRPRRSRSPLRDAWVHEAAAAQVKGALETLEKAGVSRNAIPVAAPVRITPSSCARGDVANSWRDAMSRRAPRANACVWCRLPNRPPLHHAIVGPDRGRRWREGAGIIAFRHNRGNLDVLLVNTKKFVLGFPKGGRKGGESVLENALREWHEETGLPGHCLDFYENVVLVETYFGTHYFVAKWTRQQTLEEAIAWAPPNEDPTDNDPVIKAQWMPVIEAAKHPKLHDDRRALLRVALQLASRSGDSSPSG